MTSHPDYDRIATLLEQEARIKLELAQAFRIRASGPRTTSDGIRPFNLGSLQQSIFDVLLTVDESGFSPREIAKKLDRGDEPNVRSALNRMEERGVVELVSNVGAQRWRLATPYRRL